MKFAITVANKDEGEQIRAGLEDPAVRAFVKVYGVLQALPTNRARRRVLEYFADHAAERSVIEMAPKPVEVS
jgi:hypothetical protein